MKLSALELVDVLLGRVRGTELEPIAREIRSTLIAERTIARPTAGDAVRAAMQVAAGVCGVPETVDLSRRFGRGDRLTRVHLARHVAMYLLWHFSGLSTPRIAREFDLQDHTTVIYGRDKVAERIRMDRAFAERMEHARVQLDGGSELSEAVG